MRLRRGKRRRGQHLKVYRIVVLYVPAAATYGAIEANADAADIEECQHHRREIRNDDLDVATVREREGREGEICTVSTAFPLLPSPALFAPTANSRHRTAVHQ